ncbi:hypothetical protein OG413_46745 [Streptomyces sp. NBC_01433]|uniref:hypothetical protein n=1 Tax=Streptomyces sp. NBC_01433 TaxID=2903864 RepID=UPI00225AF074|nr:hypothetical protein [Streptomyces sp. NBC_01433]MCX4682648.1 hypothetical protein [Streptomyces sp. NBC_01433]MCX4682688.1 hypothetical protein [Streptomyces sp. NBC_01433]
MFENRRAQQRHNKLMRAADKLVAPLEAPATPADLAALAFGLHRIELREDEAARYLDAARVGRGYRLPEPLLDIESAGAKDADTEEHLDLDQEEPEPAAVN